MNVNDNFDYSLQMPYSPIWVIVVIVVVVVVAELSSRWVVATVVVIAVISTLRGNRHCKHWLYTVRNF